MTRVKMWLHEDYQSDEMEEVYTDEWETLGIPREHAVAFIETRPTYEVGLVLEYNETTHDFDLVGVEGLGGRDYTVSDHA